MRNLILLCAVVAFSCVKKETVVNTLEFPDGPVLQIMGTDTFQYPSLEDAVIISGYDSLTILVNLNKNTLVDGYEFKTTD